MKSTVSRLLLLQANDLRILKYMCYHFDRVVFNRHYFHKKIIFEQLEYLKNKIRKLV